MTTRVARRFGVVSRVLGSGDLAGVVAAAARTGVDGIGVELDEVLAVGVPAARLLLDDAGLAASSVLSVGPALASAGTGPTDAELEALDVAAELGAPGVLASTGPLGDLPSRTADTRCRAWLERLALPRSISGSW